MRINLFAITPFLQNGQQRDQRNLFLILIEKKLSWYDRVPGVQFFSRNFISEKWYEIVQTCIEVSQQRSIYNTSVRNVSNA